MRAMTRVKAAVAASLAMGLALVAAPAFAAPGDPVLAVTNTTFSAGSWGTGVEFTVTGVPADIDTVTLYVGSSGEMGGGEVGHLDVTRSAGDVFTGTVIPADTPIMAGPSGYPKYFAAARYILDDPATEWLDMVQSNSVELTITEGMSVTGPESATVAQLAAGVELQFKGFVPNEQLAGEILMLDVDNNTWTEIGVFQTTVGADGSGVGTLTITNAPVGAHFRVLAAGQLGEVMYYVQAVAEAPVDNGNGGATPPAAPVKPVKVDTGL